MQQAKIAEGSLKRFEPRTENNHPPVRAMVQSHPIPEFERHIAAWTAEVMDGKSAGLHDIDDPIELALPAFGKLEGAPGAQASGADARDKGEEKTLVTGIKRDVQENTVGFGPGVRWHSVVT